MFAEGAEADAAAVGHGRFGGVDVDVGGVRGVEMR